MEDYRELVERLARERTGHPIYNSSIDHASIILEKLFRHASKEVCILSSKLNNDVFGQEAVTREVDAFMKVGGTKARIVVEDDIDTIAPAHPLFDVLRKYPGQYEIRQMSDGIKQQVDYHFAVADGDSYRYEPQKTEWKAVAAFGNKDVAENLGNIFTVIWSAASPVKLADNIAV